ncbi:unnamed protein product [Caenorhabditis brenneri]
MLLISALSCLLVTALAENANIIGSPCSKNQVISKLTVYENGTIEIGCAPVPCGEVGSHCVDDNIQCRNETEVPTALKRGPNNQSILFRCCTMQAKKRIHVGTDIVRLRSFYAGGEVASKDLYGNKGDYEFDFVANARSEKEGGVRVWVDRMFCPKENKSVEFDSITTTSAPKVTKITPAPVPTTPVDKEAGNDNIFGSPCSKNQVISKLTLFEDGKIAIECAPVTCMQVRSHCVDDQIECRARTDPETEILSGIRWASNNDSMLLRCFAAKDLYGPEGDDEFDFVANAKAEEAGLRVWVYRMFCPKGENPVDFESDTTTFSPKAIKTTAPPVPTTPVNEKGGASMKKGCELKQIL